MSFLSGLAKVGSWISGSSFTANLAKTAITAYTVYRMNRNLNKQNNPEAEIDQGVRLQINPSAENKIPVVYGAAFLSGIITDAEMSGNNKTMHFCVTISEKTGTVFSTNAGSVTTFREIYYNDQRVTFKTDGVTVDFTQDRTGVVDRSLEGRVRIYCYDGNSATPRGVQGFNTPASVNAAALIPSWNTSTHQMNNLVFAVVRVDYDKDRGVTGLGTVKFHIENSMTRPGDCLFDYFVNTIYGASVPAAEINTATLTALNTYSDQSVVYQDQLLGANQVLAARYRINGVVDTSKSVLDNIENLASSAASWISYDVQSGQWSVVINRDDTAVAAFDDSTVIGSVSLNGTGIDDLYNRVKADFPNRDIRDAADFITIALPAGDRNPNEYENTLNIAYELINEPVQAEILSFIELKQSRVDLVVRFTTDYSFTTLTAGDVISLTNGRINWTDKLFRIVSINEKQDDSGQLLVDITALEYDPSVYSVLDLFRFARSDQNGIIGIGSIGVPGTPIVSKIEVASRPRIIATSTSPTGIVERMEFWRTTDVGLAESQRNYTLIGSVNPVGGGTFGIGQTVTFEYDSQGAGNFLIKTRGVNTVTTGPFSEPSGVIEFQPQQTTDAIGPDTTLSGLVGALGALELLDLLNRLMNGEAGELFEKIFSIFEDETGTDILGDAKDGELVVAADVVIKADGTELTSTVSSIDFVKPLAASNQTTDVTVGMIPGAANKDILAWNAGAGQWQLISGCITCEFPPPAPGEPGGPPLPEPPKPCSLTATLFPSNTSNNFDPCEPQTGVPFTGSYYMSFAIASGDTDKTNDFYAPLQRGVGSVYLYGTDGVLEQTLTESSVNIINNVLELPFAARQPGKDYYILVDDGLVTSCTCENVAIDSSDTWRFRTSLLPTAPLASPVPVNLTPVPPDESSVLNPQLTVTGFAPIGAFNCVSGNSISITYSEAVAAGSGQVVVRQRLTGSIVTALDIASATIAGSTVTFPELTDLSSNSDFDIEVPAALVVTARPTLTQTVCDATVPLPAPPQVASNPAAFGFSTTRDLEFELVQTCLETSGFTSVNSNIVLQFNKAVVAGAGPAFVNIFESGGGLHQKIDLTGTFETLQYGAIYTVANNTVRLNPTKPFKAATQYHVTIDAGAVVDAECGIPYVGITDTNTIVFETEGVQMTLPTGPTFGSISIQFELSRQVRPGPGLLNIIDADTGSLYTQVSSTDPAVQFSDSAFV